MGRTSNKERLRMVIRQNFLFSVMGLLIWQVVAVYVVKNPLLLPSLTELLPYLAEELLEGDLLLQLWRTVVYLVVALGLATGMAIGVTYLAEQVTWINQLFRFLNGILHPLPAVAIFPIIMLWVGVGRAALILTMLHSIFWPLYANLTAGMSAVEQEYLDAAKNNGASSWPLFWQVLLPMSKTALHAGVLIGWSRGWRAIISAELIFGAISFEGVLGFYLAKKRAFMDSRGMFSALLLMMVVGLIGDRLIRHWFTEDVDGSFSKEKLLGKR